MGKKFDLDLCYDKLYKQIADQIQKLIISEALRPGDKLPGERELAEQLGISRTVVREAIRLLSVRGLVEVKPGCGTYVREPSPKDAAAPIELLLKLRQCPNLVNHLYEIRHMIEVEIAGLAAERATDEDCAEMATAIEDMADHAADPEQFIQYDLAFHSLLAAATGNDLFSVLLNAIADLWTKGALLAYRAPGAVEDALGHHRNVLQQIRERDPDEARQAMRDHIRHSQSLVEAVRHQLDES